MSQAGMWGSVLGGLMDSLELPRLRNASGAVYADWTRVGDKHPRYGLLFQLDAWSSSRNRVTHAIRRLGLLLDRFLFKRRSNPPTGLTAVVN